MIGTLIAAWLDVRTKPFRTFAAIAGMVAAVVAVVLVDAAGVLSHKANDAYLARQYGLPISVGIQANSGIPTADQVSLLEATLDANGITAYSLDVTLPLTVVYGQTVVWDGIRWVDPEFTDVRIVDMVAGAWPRATADSDVYHVVLNAGWAQTYLGLSDQTVVGHVIGYADTRDIGWDGKSTPQIPMVVDGVVATNTIAFGGGSAPVSIVSSRTPPETPGYDLIPSWTARVNPGDFGFIQELVASVIGQDGQPVFQARRADQGDQLAPVLAQQDVTAQAVSIVALAIGGLGIFGVGLAGVRERSKDFGLRRALGASTVRVFIGVIAQTMIEVLIAAAVAIPLAALLLEIYARDLVLESLPLPPSTALPLSSVMVGLAGAQIVGLIAGLVPAITAARASVVQALRG
jgi:putative ABC transport system permease protein